MVNPRFIFIVVAIALGLSSLGCSQSPSPAPVPPADEDKGQAVSEGSKQPKRLVRWWRDDSVVAELGLSDDQLQTINELMIGNSGDTDKQLKLERQFGLRYLRALNEDPYDAAQVDHLSARLIEILSSEHRRRIDTVRKLRDTLTKEQWLKLWDVAPRALHIGRFMAARGVKVSVTEDYPAPPPALVP
ncbi:MAG: hypothetical protein ABFS37_15595 [Acidobacteriota bacterium]